MRALVLLLACACTSTPAAKQPAPHRTGTFHDPDLRRGALPSAPTRQHELAAIREALDRMYAHRKDKEARYGIDEDALFGKTEDRLVAATTWEQYDAAIYGALAAFHDSHLTYHPPETAAPARGYTSFRLGLTTVLAHDHLLVATSELAGVAPGDEVIAIDGMPVADVLRAAVEARAVSRPEAATAAFAKTWTSVLYPKGDAPRARRIRTRDRAGAEHDIAIAPRESKGKHEVVAIEQRGDVAVRGDPARSRAARRARRRSTRRSRRRARRRRS